MAENQGQTITAPVNNHPAPSEYQAPATTPMWGPPVMTFEVPQEQLDSAPPVAGGGRSAGFVNRLRTPAVAAVIGGVLLLGVGFATGYVVGHDRGSSSVSSTTGGQTGTGGSGPGLTGQGQTGQGGTGTSPFGQLPGGTGTSPFGQGQDGSQLFGGGTGTSDGTSDGSGTTTTDGSTTSFSQT